MGEIGIHERDRIERLEDDFREMRKFLAGMAHIFKAQEKVLNCVNNSGFFRIMSEVDNAIFQEEMDELLYGKKSSVTACARCGNTHSHSYFPKEEGLLCLVCIRKDHEK